MSKSEEMIVRSRVRFVTATTHYASLYCAVRVASVSSRIGNVGLYLPIVLEPKPQGIIKIPTPAYYIQGPHTASGETEYWSAGVSGDVHVFPELPTIYYDSHYSEDVPLVNVKGAMEDRIFLVSRKPLIVSELIQETATLRSYRIPDLEKEFCGTIGGTTVRMYIKDAVIRIQKTLGADDVHSAYGYVSLKWALYPDWPDEPGKYWNYWSNSLRRYLPSEALELGDIEISSYLRTVSYEYPNEWIEELRYMTELCGLSPGYATENMVANIPGFHDMNMIAYAHDLTHLSELSTQLTGSVSSPISHILDAVKRGDAKGLKHLVKDGANAVLIKQFAFDTLLSDTQEVDEMLQFFANYDIPPIQTYRGRYSAEIKDERTGRTWVATFRCKAAVDMLPDEINEPIKTLKKGARQLLDSGFMPTLSNIWDMIPYSFVVNWVFTTGDLVSQIDHLAYQQTLNVVNATYSEKYESEIPLSRLGIPETGFSILGKVNYTAYHRWPTKSLIDVPVSWPKLDLSGWGWNNRTLLATSLVLQKTKI